MTSDLDTLVRFDPETAGRLVHGLEHWPAAPDPDLVQLLAGEILKALAVEPAFGKALADGLLQVIAAASPAALARYRDCVRHFAEVGPTLGRIMAIVLAPVTVRGGDGLLDAAMPVVAVMHRKGTHTLADTMDALVALLAIGDLPAAHAYLRLLGATFSRSLTYNRTTHLTKHLPRAVLRLQGPACAGRLGHLTTAMAVSDRLAECLWESLISGDLRLLSGDGLGAFVADACRRFAHDPEAGLAFAALRSHQGRQACASMRVAVALADVRVALGAYAGLRLGRGCAIRPAADLLPAAGGDPPSFRMGTDGRDIYLPEVMDHYPQAPQNRAAYHGLVRLYCGVLESGTHDFDMDKAADRLGAARTSPGDTVGSELTCWFARYGEPRLAAYLFCLFEQARVQLWSRRRYPGAVRQALPFLDAACQRTAAAWPAHPFTPLVRWSAAPWQAERTGVGVPAVAAAMDAFAGTLTEAATVEDTAVFLDGVYPSLASLVAGADAGLPALPFGGIVRTDGPGARCRAEHHLAWRVQKLLAHSGVPVYRSELIRQYRDDGDSLTSEGVRLAVTASARCIGAEVSPAAAGLCSPAEVDALFVETFPQLDTGGAGEPVFWYPEWDARQGDYRVDHVRVRIGRPACADAACCAAVLRERYPLVARIRRAFELLRPQGLVLLRRWMEGDDFDYRALLDFAVDRRAGLMPPERVYIKRLKAHRDVATLLLVDQSRSTAHHVQGARQSIMDVEKEAIVLFCEALGVLGDRFAVAGFSGTGRLGVDYFRVKDFDEPMGPGVWARIAGMTPQRSTRMGAAIRHAAAAFATAPAAIRLLIILGDGFPNDVDYKKGYALTDTRKAIQEAHARHIHTYGITVNIAGGGGLDALYGGGGHTVISDVRQLPDVLWRVYANLTRR